MSKKQTTMNINGRVYDVKTGQVLKVEHSKSTVVSKKSIDGFIKNAAPLDLSKTKPAKARRNAKVASKTIHKRTAKGERLHPAIRKAAQTKANTPQISKFKHAAKNRKLRAKTSEKSKNVARHAKPVVATPKATVKDDAPEVAPPMPSFVSRRAKKAPKLPPKTVQNDEDNEYINSMSWIKKHLIPAAASFAGLALLSGFLVYNSLPDLSMRVAASRAGFNASVPNYQPSGYSFDGPSSYGPGRVVLDFTSKTDDREYTLTERQSNWDSASLLENYVVDRSENFLTLEEHGLTIYIYEKDKATWVDGGVWYQIEGDANLSSEQIIKIASSL